MLSHSDVAGPYSGTLFGFTNTMAQIPGFANALIVANFTPNVSILKSILLVVTPLRIPGISGLKSQILKPPFLS